MTPTPNAPTVNSHLKLHHPNKQYPVAVKQNGRSSRNETSVRQIRVPEPNRKPDSGYYSSCCVPGGSHPNDCMLEKQRLSQLMMKCSYDSKLVNLVHHADPASIPSLCPPRKLIQSREYWAAQIDPSIEYPGEDASKTVKRAYK